MNITSQVKTAALAALVFGAAGNLSAQAQKPLETSTDEKYANTTIVYRNDKTTSDAEILSQIEKDYGMGDVVRISETTPKPKATPVVAKNAPVTTTAPAAKTVGVPNAIRIANDPAVKPAAKEEGRPTQKEQSSIAEQAPAQWLASEDVSVAMKQVAAPTYDKKAPTGERNYSNISEKPVVEQKTVAPQVGTKNIITTAKAPNVSNAPKTAPKTTVKTTTTTGNTAKMATKTGSSAKSGGTVKTTGKIYKHKRKSRFQLNLNLFPKTRKSGKQSYKCYKF